MVEEDLTCLECLLFTTKIVYLGLYTRFSRRQGLDCRDDYVQFLIQHVSFLIHSIDGQSGDLSEKLLQLVLEILERVNEVGYLYLVCS